MLTHFIHNHQLTILIVQMTSWASWRILFIYCLSISLDGLGPL